MIEDSREKIQFFVANAIYIQHVDSTYDSINFDDPISTLSYYKRLRRFALLHNRESSKEDFDRWLEIVVMLVPKEKGSKISADVPAHSIMKSAAEEIHNAFRKLNRKSYANIAPFVMNVIIDADYRLFRLMEEYFPDEMK